MLQGDRKQIKSYEDLEVYQESFELVMNEKPPTPNTQDLRPKKEGFALIFTILILVGMLAASLVISSIILRVAHSVGKITDSEIAYYGAETAAEKTLYQINKKYIKISDISIEGELASGAQYILEEHIQEDTIDPFDESEITNENSLEVSLNRSGQSFQLDLDINGVNYPSSLRFSGISGRLAGVILSGGTEPETESLLEENLPYIISIDEGKYYRFRVIADSGGTLTITPDSGTLTIGTIITTKGSYRGTERILETKNPKWQIY